MPDAPPGWTTTHPIDRLRLELVAAELGEASVVFRALDGRAPRAAEATEGAADGRLYPGRPNPGRSNHRGSNPGRHNLLPVVAAAGTILGGETGGRAAVGALLASAARGTVVAGLGLGAGPVPRPVDRILARHLSRHARLLVMRSEAAAHRLAVAGVAAPIRIGADLAWLQPPAPPVIDRNDDLLVLGGLPDPYVTRVLAEALPALVADGFRVVLAGWAGRADPYSPELTTTLALRLPPDRLESPPAWSDANAAFVAAARSRAVVALDVDAQVVAALAGTPAVVISGDEECLALAGQLGQPALAPSTSDRRLVAALAEPPPPSRDRRDAVESLRQRARESVRLLRLVVSPRHSSDGDAGGDLPLWPEPLAR